MNNLPKKRSVLLECLEIIDTLIGTEVSFDGESHQISVACSAKPEKIDRDLGILRDNDVVARG